MKISPQLGIRKITADAGSDKDISSDEDSNLFDRPVTESATAWAGRDSHGPSDEYWTNFGRPVMEAMTEMAGNDASISRDECSDFPYERTGAGGMRFGRIMDRTLKNQLVVLV